MARIKLVLIIIFLTFLVSCGNNIIVRHKLISDTNRIKNDLDKICHTDEFRNYKNVKTLNKVADYIKSQFEALSDSVIEQKYNVNDAEYKNIICSIGDFSKERIIIGAHYDVCGEQEGADDNASGICGLIELARFLSKEKLNYRIDFVAYTLEEPPFFRTDKMGSYIHAKYLKDNNIPIKGMICLEMLGFYSDIENSQSYPLGVLSWKYGDKGNFVLVAKKWFNGSFGGDIFDLMQDNMLIPTKSLSAPSWLASIDFSDHLNYWNFGYSAIMITNTSFYRNDNYHKESDKIETLDIKRMAFLIDELLLALKAYNLN